MKKAHWLWHLSGIAGSLHGYVEAVDPRDALSRALTSELPSGRMLGEEKGIPADVLHAAPCNADTMFEARGEGFVIRVEKLHCPSEARHPGDVLGCGSASVSGPDEEGLFDCDDCGLFFNPLTANADLEPANEAVG